MLVDSPKVAAALDNAVIGFLTAVNRAGQPQTSPVWFLRSGEELIVYNKADSPRLASIAGNSQVAFSLRGDPKATGAILLEGRAHEAPDIGPSWQNDPYQEKYRAEIARLGWTPRSFAADYPVPIRIEVTRVRSWGLEVFDDPANL